MSCRRAWKSAPISARRQPRAQGERTGAQRRPDGAMSWASHTAERVSKAIGLDEGSGQSARARGIGRMHVLHLQHYLFWKRLIKCCERAEKCLAQRNFTVKVPKCARSLGYVCAEVRSERVMCCVRGTFSEDGRDARRGKWRSQGGIAKRPTPRLRRRSRGLL